MGLEDDEREEEHVAQRRLGFAYENGELCLLTDEEEAQKWHRKAAEGACRLGFAVRPGDEETRRARSSGTGRRRRVATTTRKKS